MRRRLLVLLVVVLALPAPAHAAFPGQNGKIAFDADSGATTDVYSVNADGSGQTNLSNHAAFDSNAAWSPDGRKVAFQSIRDGNVEIYVMNADGTGQTRLTNSSPYYELRPAWSPDGSRIVFEKVHISSSVGQLFVMNSDGTDEAQLTFNVGGDFGPSWSPDGETIAFSRDQCLDPLCEGIDTALWVMAADGSAQSEVPNTGNGTEPNWSPDGARIAFQSSGTIETIKPDGTGLVATGVPGEVPAWSPDGSKIVFWVGAQIRVMNPDGTGVTAIGVSGRRPDWQPVPVQSTPAPPYDHPRLASPVKVSLVPNFRQTITNSQCAARGGLNSNHGPPLAFAACNPPGFVPGTIAHMGPASDSWASYAVIYGDTNAANGDQANMTLRASMNDIRTAGGADYTQSLTLVTKLRITDRFNGGSQTDPATVSDFETFTPIACTATAGPEGANCNLDSSLDAQTPGAIKENKGTVVQVFRFRVNDSGANGTRGDADDRTFAVQGIYIP